MPTAASECASLHFNTEGMTEDERESVAAYEAMVGLNASEEELQAAFARAAALKATPRVRRAG